MKELSKYINTESIKETLEGSGKAIGSWAPTKIPSVSYKLVPVEKEGMLEPVGYRLVLKDESTGKTVGETPTVSASGVDPYLISTGLQDPRKAMYTSKEDAEKWDKNVTKSFTGAFEEFFKTDAGKAASRAVEAAEREGLQVTDRPNVYTKEGRTGEYSFDRGGLSYSGGKESDGLQTISASFTPLESGKTLFKGSPEYDSRSGAVGPVNVPKFSSTQPDGSGGSGSTTAMPNPQKVRALQAAKNMYGYEGGAAQARKDQALLKSTRLGMREADGSFRLRTADEIAARNREGRASINQPKRDVMKNFRDRYGDGVGGSRLEQEMKQFQKDTGVKDPLKLESDTRANEQMRAFEQTARDRQKTLEKYRVKEPEPMSAEVAKGFENTEANRKRMKKILGS